MNHCETLLTIIEDGDAQHWKPRTLGIDGASVESIRSYIAELDARAAAMSAQLAKDRLAAFRDKVRKAVREAKDRLITGWVGEESSPPISVVQTAQGQHLVQPTEVAAAFAKEWGSSGCPPGQQQPAGLSRGAG